MYRRSMGDPGFFGNLARGIGGVVGGVVKGFVTGGPLGAVRGAITGTVGAVRTNVRASTLEAGGSGSAYTPQLRAQHAAALARAARSSAAPIGGSAAGTPAGKMLMAGAAMGGGGGGRRRMNPYNPRALTRANRRMHSFLKHARRFLGFYHSSAQAGKTVKFKRPKGRR